MLRAQTLPRAERLHYGHEFRQVYASNRRAAGKLAVVHVLEQPHAAGPAGRGFGVVTSRRLGCATLRNRARRLVREVYRRQKQHLKPNIQLVIVARAAIAGCSYAELEAELVNLFRRVGVWVG